MTVETADSLFRLVCDVMTALGIPFLAWMVNRTHKSTNSKMDQMMEINKEMYFAKGKEAQRIAGEQIELANRKAIDESKQNPS
jgi:hypothetical protein